MNLQKFILVCVLLVYSLLPPDSNAVVTSNVFMRVLKIRVGQDTGTAFTMDVEGRQYLITAKHMINDLKQEDSIDIYMNDRWVPLKVKVLKCEEPIDIAVLIPPKVLTVSFPLEPQGSQQIFTGQDVYFVGFPYGLVGGVNWENVSGNSPAPYEKKAILSSVSKEGAAVQLTLDGINNPGFSGGPIVFRELKDTLNFSASFYVAGVISAFRTDYLPVTQPRLVKDGEDISKIESWRKIKRQDGKIIILENTGQVVVSNTGLIIGYGIKHAIDLIQKNPMGPKITP